MDRLDAIATFVAVAEGASFVAAARRLGRSPAAVTRAVAALEDRLGTRLFTRTTRSVALTDAGRRQLERCQTILAEVAALESSAATEQGDAHGPLLVTASVVFGRLHVLPLVADFLRRHPAVEVRLLLSDEVLPLVDEGIDVGIRIAKLGDSSLKAVRVGTVKRALYASPAYLAARGEPATPAELARHDCVVLAGTDALRGDVRWTFGRGASRRTVAIMPRLVANLAEPVIDAAVAGVGITRVLSYMVDHLVRAGTLRPVLEAYEPAAIPVHVVHSTGRHLPVRTRLFVDHAVTLLRRQLGGEAAARVSQ